MEVRGKQHRIFIKFMLSYLVILFIPFLMGSVVYNGALDIIERDAKENNLAMLEQTRDIIDRRLDEIDALVNQLALNTNVNDLFSISNPFDDPTAVYKISNVRKELMSFKLVNNFIENFYIYFKDADIVVSPHASYLRMPYFYGNSFKYANMNYQEWYEKIYRDFYFRKYLPAMPVIINRQQRPMISYIQSIPIKGISSVKGVIIVLFKESEIHKLLDRLPLQNGGWAYIIDENDTIITKTSEDFDELEITNISLGRGFLNKEMLGKDMIVSYTTSTYNGWRYVVGVPAQIIMEKVDYIKNMILLIMTSALVGGLLLAYFMAYYNSKPIKDIIAILKEKLESESSDPKNEYLFLKTSINDLINRNKHMRDDIENQKPFLRVTFLERLFRGSFNDIEEIKTFFEETGLKIGEGKYTVVITQIGEYFGEVNKELLFELNMIKVLMKEVVTRQLKDNNYYLDIDFNTIALLLKLNEYDELNYKEYISRVINKIYQELIKKYRTKAVFAVGGLSESLLEVSTSFQQAKQALEYAVLEDQHILIWYGEVPTRRTGYYYPMHIEMQLMKYAKSGEYQGIQKLFFSLYNENFTKQSLSIHMTNQFIVNFPSFSYSISSRKSVPSRNAMISA